MLERREVVGGVAVTEEFAPGFRASTLLHAAGPLPAVDRPRPRSRAPRPLVHPDRRRGSSLRRLDGARDRARRRPAGRRPLASRRSRRTTRRATWPSTRASAGSATVLAPLLTMTPPSIDDPSMRRDVGARSASAASSGRCRAATRSACCAGGPMAVADLVSEFFETRAAARRRRRPRHLRGLRRPVVGRDEPRRAPPGRERRATPPGPPTFVRGGMGALDAGARGRRARLRRRGPHGSDRSRASPTKDGARRRRRALDRARRSRRAPSSRTPTRSGRCSASSTRSSSTRTSSGRCRTTASHGAIAKVNLALSGLPDFPSAAAAGGQNVARRAASTSAPRSTTSSAPTTPPSTATSRPTRTATSRSRR